MDKMKRIDCINKTVNYLLFTYTVLFILDHTVVSLYVGPWLERLECIIGAILAVTMFLKLITLEKDEKLMWLKSIILIFVYFLIRIASFIETGFDYSVARTVFFEGIYLLVICGIIIDSQFCKKKILKVFVVLNLVLNILNVVTYYILVYVPPQANIYQILIHKTFVLETKLYNTSMYDNPNAFGIMTALAMIVALNLVSKNDTIVRKIILVVYFVFSLYCVNLSECRSAILSLFVCAVSWALVVITKNKITGKMLVIVAFSFAVAITGGLYGFMHENKATGLYTFNQYETSIEDLSSGRYSIWKNGFYANKDDRLLGAGSLKNEMKDRNDYVYQYYIDNEIDMSKYTETRLGPHNGYFAMLYCTGILGFIAFMAVFLQKILQAESLKHGGWYLAVIFFMSVNMFETMTIVSRFFVCLLTFIILAMDNNDEENGYELEHTDEAKLL